MREKTNKNIKRLKKSPFSKYLFKWFIISTAKI